MAKKYVPTGRHCHSWTSDSRSTGGAGRSASRVLARLPGASRGGRDRAQSLRAEAARGHGEHVVARAQLLGEPVRDAPRAGVRATGARSDPARPLARRRAARPHPQPDDLQHADQPADLPRDGARRGQRRLAADLRTDDREQPLGPERRGGEPLPRPRVRRDHRLPDEVRALASRSRWTRRATTRCGARSRCGAKRCAPAARSSRAPRPSATSGSRPRCSATRARSARRSTTRTRAVEQLIELARVGAPLRLLHHRADQHALQLLLAVAEALRLGRVLGDHLVQPARRAARRRPPSRAPRARRSARADRRSATMWRRSAWPPCGSRRRRARGRAATPDRRDEREARSRPRPTSSACASTSPITQFAAAFGSPCARATAS